MILIVDDDKSIRLSLSVLLRRGGYEALAVESPDAAIEAMRREAPQLILMDMNYGRSTDGEEGLELLMKCRVLVPQTPVILITAWGSIPLAVRGMQAGAYDFVTKPWDPHLLLERIETAVQLTSPSQEGGAAGESAKRFDRCGIIGKSPALTEVLKTVERVAATNAPVLILGENGTGKEMIAQAIHTNSKRASGPFVQVNLGGISQSLFESEMFGHAKGAFTGAVAARKGRFELADKGTIFLDEIGDLDAASQVKMLRVLQQHTFEPLGDSRPRKVDIRVVCATNADLAAMVANRSFREDLFYRINLITLRLPPLRERREDIPLLARHFAALSAKALSMECPEISADALAWLSRRPYPGNIRELKNLVERTMIVCGSDTLASGDFERCADNTPKAPGETVAPVDGATLEDIEKAAITSAMQQHSGNLSRVAESLGITRQSLYRRLEKYGMTTDRK